MRIEVSRQIAAPAERIYGIVADYRVGHPKILPSQFRSLTVEQGGVGAGTIIRCEMKAFGSIQTFRASVSEPLPGRKLVESNIGKPESVTTFLVEPEPGLNASKVTISTEYKTRSGLLGRIEGYFVYRLLHPMYIEELKKLDLIANSST